MDVPDELPSHYRALVVRESAAGGMQADIESLPVAGLPEHDTLVRVHYSSLNYKDYLSASGNRGITRHYPHTPGVDAAGVVLRSAASTLPPGTPVVITGFDLGMNTPGGFGEVIRVPSDWVIPVPDGMTMEDTMVIGTAGFTAAQSLYRMQQNGLRTDKGEVLVTGATGGVGSVAVALLSRAGYRVTAVTRQTGRRDWLQTLGATAIVSPTEVLVESEKPMLKARWAGAVDTVGGALLESILRTTQHRAVVTCCGMIGGVALQTNIFPFILRGLTLVGIDSAECPLEMKREIWSLLAGPWKLDCLETLRTVITMDEVKSRLAAMGQGQTIGRLVVRHAGV